MTHGSGERGDRSLVAVPVTRRRFVQAGAGAGAGLLVWRFVGGRAWAQPLGTSVLDAASIPKYATPLVIPPAMPRSGKLRRKKGSGVDYYGSRFASSSSRSCRRAWGSGRPRSGATARSTTRRRSTIRRSRSRRRGGRPVRVKWINELVKPDGNFRPHLLPVDQTLHWANPPGGIHGRDGARHATTTRTAARCRSSPTCTAATATSRATATPRPGTCRRRATSRAGYARVGSKYQRVPGARPGRARPGVDARQRRVPVRQRPARGDDVVPRPHARDDARSTSTRGRPASTCCAAGPTDAVGGTLPGPAPALGDPPGREYFEIPIAIQDRSFNDDGALFYPDNRAFFEGLDPSQLQIPFCGDPACGGPSDVAPIWNPEFFGNAIVVNGRTWP